MIPRRKIHIQRREFLLALRYFLSKSPCNIEYLPNWEKNFAGFLGVKHAISVGSARHGMELLLRSLGLKAGDEVVIPAYTLGALTGIIESLGLKPVPADINPETFNSEPSDISRAISERTKVIIATHIFGNPCRIDKIKDIAEKRNITVFEDCAHSLGSQIYSKQTGSLAEASFFSFENIKLVNTYGGGMVATNSDFLSERVKSFVKRNPSFCPFKKVVASLVENLFLSSPFAYPFFYLLSSPEWNIKIYKIYRKTQKSLVDSKISFGEFQARLALEKLASLGQRIAERRRKADIFISILGKYTIPQKVYSDARHNYYFFVTLIKADSRKLRRFLLKKGIDAGTGSEIADNWPQERGFSCPNAVKVYKSAIQFPLYENLSDEKVVYIAEKVKDFLR
ncbi:MAG: aminotransferase class I/II-fold pyridoxal phosphate-dependent enzyme [Candidatus Omnitrophica bacterium]|nr:aminotransferase class I/II-fold pyridoxal phosphate-dependent enzyme [Candidatus Omnitrophota bacterium]MBD3269059.1 aminotransferase class I/II-fold pyridoxal phosphate-dependent enzyme [Candidatus Omnitrophota bacterium]